MHTKHQYLPHLIATIGLLLAGEATAGVDLGKVDALLKAGKALEGYQLLAPEEFEMAGNIDYDYLLGIAALDSGKPDKASLALERVLAVNPNYVGARLDLARAYFALEDYERAKDEFKAVQTQNPPAVAQTVINQYLSAIDMKMNPKTTITGYAEGSLGYDTNINTLTSATQMTILGTTLLLDSATRSATDNYLTLGGGMEIKHPVKPGLSLFANFDAKKRVHFYKDTYNADSLDSKVGINIDDGPNVYRLSAQKGLYTLDDKFNRSLEAVAGEWRYTLNQRNMFSAFGQYGMLRYDTDKTGADLSASDIDLSILGLGWFHALDDQGKILLFASGYGGYENTVAETTRTDGDQVFWGVKLGGQISLMPDLAATGSIGLKDGSYDTVNSQIPDYRHDTTYDLTLGLNWKPMPNWVVRPQISYTRNDSNSLQNDYDRTDASITVRRDFK